MHCIVTAFDAFAGLPDNPSQLALERLGTQGGKPRAADIRLLTLPTCCQAAWSCLEQALANLDREPFALVLSGYARTRRRISLERFALNVREYGVADNQGHQWNEEFIEKTGPDAIRTAVALAALLAHLESRGLACELSNHAGSFVCNEIYYRSLHKWQQHPQCAGIVFLHVPDPALYVQAQPSSASVARDKSRATSARKHHKAPGSLSAGPGGAAATLVDPIAHYSLALAETARFITDGPVHQGPPGR